MWSVLESAVCFCKTFWLDVKSSALSNWSRREEARHSRNWWLRKKCGFLLCWWLTESWQLLGGQLAGFGSYQKCKQVPLFYISIHTMLRLMQIAMQISSDSLNIKPIQHQTHVGIPLIFSIYIEEISISSYHFSITLFIKIY